MVIRTKQAGKVTINHSIHVILMPMILLTMLIDKRLGASAVIKNELVMEVETIPVHIKYVPIFFRDESKGRELYKGGR